MPLTKQRLHYLLNRYADDRCTKQELFELFQAIDQGEADDELKLAMDQILKNMDVETPTANVNKERMFQQIVAQPKAKTKKLWLKWAAAAAAIVLFFNAYWFVVQKPATESQVFVSQRVKDKVMPGGNRAVLTLADGSKISLDEASKGIVAKQGAIEVVKAQDGQLAYLMSPQTDGTVQLFNAIVTPNGGQYQLTLSDGTQVWLNAASSIRYPTTFEGKERNVEVTGEVYFEVAHQANRPFKVKINTIDGADGGTVEVLGTHFNINAYPGEEAIKTSLLQGRVKVYKGNYTALLSPGKQASFLPNGSSISVRNADMDQVVGWKNGYFIFERSDIQTVMRQLSRWYDVEVKYEGKITGDKFGGSIPRTAPLNQVLKTLEESMVHFKIRGRTVVVTD